jgi:hypothetical protein
VEKVGGKFRMKKIMAVLIVALLTCGLAQGCQGGTRGSGKLQTENYNYSDFIRVEVSSAFKVEITQSNSYSVEVTADDNLLEYVEVSQDGDKLKIDLKKVTLLWPVTLEAKIAMPELRGLVLSGATRGTVSKLSSTRNLDIELSGASSLNLVDISAGDVKFNIYGASKVSGNIVANDTEFNIDEASTAQLKGSASNMKVDAQGSSRVELAEFEVENVAINLSGASSGTVNVHGRLDADLGEASKLSYIGEPTMGTIKTSGASTLSWE